ncbi:allantoinase AllB [Alkalihalobacillus sp. FSL W8-0930]
MYDVVIRHAKVVLETGVVESEIGINNGKIAELSKTISIQGVKEIDAKGQYVFPGAVDVHVHLNEPGRAFWEGFETGSSMFAAGGTTTFVDMPLNGIPSTVTKKDLYDKARLGEEKSIVDFGLWGGLVPGNVHELAGLSEAGCLGFKAFLSPTGNKEFESVGDKDLIEGMDRIAELGKVLALHAESGPMTTFLTEKMKSQHRTTYHDYLASRPIEAEVEAVDRALHYAKITGCPLHFVHISSVAAVSRIEQAKAQGMNVSLETCPHYLLFSHEALFEKKNLAKCAPPLRKQEDHLQLRQAMKDGRIDFLTSDHSPCAAELKDASTYSIFDAWGGINGGGVTLLGAIQFAIEEKLDFSHVVNWTAKHPAERFGLSQRKGSIKEGKDADLVFVALQSHEVTLENMYARHPLSLYTSEQFDARIETVLASGIQVFSQENGPIQSRTGTWLTA